MNTSLPIIRLLTTSERSNYVSVSHRVSTQDRTSNRRSGCVYL